MIRSTFNTKTVGLFLLLILIVMSLPVQAQDDTRPDVGVRFGELDGYVLITPQDQNRVFLIDGAGHLIHEWEVADIGRDAILRENGNIVVSLRDPEPNFEESFALQAGFSEDDGAFAEYSWDGELLWYYTFNDPNEYKVHHGIEVMPNGNILFIVWQLRSVEEALANGRNPELLGDGLWPDVIMEYSPAEDAIVWQWDVWDHLIQDFDPNQANYGDVAANPQKVDINFFQDYQYLEDWMHTNAVDYNPELDQIAISVRELNEVWVIDHSISTEEARGDAGDLLYRWGNPQAYRMGDESTRFLSFQHDVRWVPSGYPGAGNLTIYSNRHSYTPEGETDSVDFSRMVEIELPPLQADGTYFRAEGAAFGPTEPTWSFDGLPDFRFYSRFISGVQRLPNGDTMILPGQTATFFTVSPEGDLTWMYSLPMFSHYFIRDGVPDLANVFRPRYYTPDFPAFVERDLTVGETLEDRASKAPENRLLLHPDTTLNETISADEGRYYVVTSDYAIGVRIEVTSLVDGQNVDVTLGRSDSDETLATVFDTPQAVFDEIAYADHLFIDVQAASGATDPIPVEIKIERLFPDLPVGIPLFAYGTVLPYDEITAEDSGSVYAFRATEGDVVSLRMTRLSGDFDPQMQLETVEGDVLFGAVASAGDNPNEVLIEGIEISTSAFYIIRVGANGDGVGTFEFEISAVE